MTPGKGRPEENRRRVVKIIAQRKRQPGRVWRGGPAEAAPRLKVPTHPLMKRRILGSSPSAGMSFRQEMAGCRQRLTPWPWRVPDQEAR